MKNEDTKYVFTHFVAKKINCDSCMSKMILFLLFTRQAGISCGKLASGLWVFLSICEDFFINLWRFFLNLWGFSASICEDFFHQFVRILFLNNTMCEDDEVCQAVLNGAEAVLKRVWVPIQFKEHCIFVAGMLKSVSFASKTQFMSFLNKVKRLQLEVRAWRFQFLTC